MKYILLSLLLAASLLAACARVPTPSIDGAQVMDAMNATTASPGAPLWFVVILVSVMFLALCLLPGSR